MKRFLLGIFLFFLLSTCSSKQIEKAAGEFMPGEAHYVIDLDGSLEESVYYSSVFKNVRTIILETSRNCLIGATTELQIFDSCIYLLDARVAKSLFVFDMEGRFIRKIGSLGNGPGEYAVIKDFTLDTENGVIYLLDQRHRVHKYQLDGTFIHSITIQMPQANSFFIQYYKERLYSSFLPNLRTKYDNMLLEIDPADGKILSQSLPVKYNKGWAEAYFSDNFFKSRLNKPPMYSQFFMDFIVSIGEEVTPYIELKSRNFFTENDFGNFPKGMPHSEMLMSFQGTSKIWNVHCYIENDDFILFKCRSGFFDSFTVIFNKKTETVKLAKKISNDLVIKKGNDTKSIFGRFKFSDSKGAYEIISPNAIIRFLEYVKSDEIIPNLDKMSQLKKLDEESNPIIFYYEFK